MEALFPSPPTRHMWGAVMETLLPWSRLPSMRHRSGRMDNPSMARFIASIRALRISKLSISSAVTKAMLYASAVAVIWSNRTSRFFAVSFLESLTPSMGSSGRGSSGGIGRAAGSQAQAMTPERSRARNFFFIMIVSSILSNLQDLD